MRHVTDAQMIKALVERLREAVGMKVDAARDHILGGAQSGIKVEPIAGTGLKVTLSAYWCDIHRGMESGHVKYMRKPATLIVAASV